MWERYSEKRRVPLLALVLLAMFMGMGVSGLLSVSKTISSSGSIKAINVEVYSDAGCTQVVSSRDWGTPGPGDVVTRTLYVKNTGNAGMTLHLSTSSWSPAGASSYITLSWDCEGVTVGAGDVATAVMTLTVSSGITGIDTFSFQTTIEGTG